MRVVRKSYKYMYTQMKSNVIKMQAYFRVSYTPLRWVHV